MSILSYQRQIVNTVIKGIIRELSCVLDRQRRMQYKIMEVHTIVIIIVIIIIIFVVVLVVVIIIITFVTKTLHTEFHG